jgi:hypothetical protein
MPLGLPMSTTIALYGAGLILVLALIYGAYRLILKYGTVKEKLTVARDENERRAEDAELAAQPMSRTPLSDLFVRDK